MRIPEAIRPRTLVVLVLREARKKGELVKPPVAPTVPLPKIDPPELIQARWRFEEALKRVPRDQAEVNRLREEVRALALPYDGLHRRGRLI